MEASSVLGYLTLAIFYKNMHLNLPLLIYLFIKSMYANDHIHVSYNDCLLGLYLWKQESQDANAVTDSYDLAGF